MPSVLSTLFRPEIHVVEAPARLVDSELYPEELDYIRRAVPARPAEFGTARVCARSALAAMGFAPAPLVPRADRAPIWPPGVVGSISHTRSYCAVVVAPSPPLRSVGLDVESLSVLEPEVIALILTPRELGWLRTQPAHRRDDLAVTVFCAKEAFYKCQYPVTEMFLEFGDVEIDLRQDDGTFAVRVLEPAWPLGTTRLEGRMAYESGRVLCGVELLV
jgi:4'-phosphopantetheinyl transferase EntD